MEEVICKETEYKRQSKGWFFVPWYCYSDTTRIDLMEMQAIISDADFNALQRLFSGEIQIPIEREDLDKYFCIAPYPITWELATYYRTLQLYNVAGKDEALFDTIKPHGLPDCTEQLLIALKRCMLIIQNNTNQPNQTRNQIRHVICAFDKLPIWGLLLQILILEGLCQMLAAGLEKNEKNSGLNEMQDLRQWLFEILWRKEVAFCTRPYLDEMLLFLAPLCEFLCTTEVGKAVQKCIIEQYYQEDTLILPAQLDTEKARKVFAKAIKLGYMEKQGNCYKWKLSKTLLACLCGMLYCGDKSENGHDGRYYSLSSTNKHHFPNIALEKLFNEQHLRVLREQKKAAALPRGFQKIEQLFE